MSSKGPYVNQTVRAPRTIEGPEHSLLHGTEEARVQWVDYSSRVAGVVFDDGTVATHDWDKLEGILPDLGGPVDVEPNGKMMLVRVLLRQPLTTEAGIVADLKDPFPTVRVMRVGDEVTRYAPGDQVQVRGGEGDVEINGCVYGWTSEAQVICKVTGDDASKLIEGISPSDREAYIEHQKRKEQEAQQKALMQRQLMTAGRSAPPSVLRGSRH